ncbi:uncharacterized protein [Diabrotica undecimpunctata]|uniref:uncharacterized protein n=1 Tax=Diabrotica undecimpunctata TaxID=50387 RepID=UPI003B639103
MCSFFAMSLSLSCAVIILLTLQPAVSEHQLRYSQEINQTSQKPPVFPKNFKSYEKCRNQICENAKDYPRKKIMKMMNRENRKYNIESLFGELFKTQQANFAIHPRVGGGTKIPKALCEFEKMSFTPWVMKNINGIWRYIVNVGKYKQTFTSENCRKTGQSINYPQDNIVCKQKMQKIHLLVFENHTIFYDEFKINATCDSSCDPKS